MDDQIYTEWELSVLRVEKPGIVYRPVLVDDAYNLDPSTMSFASAVITSLEGLQKRMWAIDPTPAEIAERDKANVESLKRWSGK